MPIAGQVTVAQLRNYLLENENNVDRKKRLFIPFGGPRAELLNQLREAVLEFVIKNQEPLKNSIVLDYGCGERPYQMAFDFVEADVVGVDIGFNLASDLQVSGDYELPFKESSFDFVTSFQVLEHVPIPHEYLRESLRVLKTGGKMFLTTHGVWPYHPTPGDFHRWTEAGLIMDFQRAGFKVEASGGVLNENSALIQALVANLYYKKKLKGYKKYFHHLTQILIRRSEKNWNRHSDIPCIITIVAEK